MHSSSEALMNKPHPKEINCSACGEHALVRVEAIYEDFKRVGESFVCTACGKRYASAEETPFAAAQVKPSVFTEADKPDIISIFGDHERQRCCAYCKHIVLNPFGQRCGVTNRFTDATDLCEHFDKK
jgi:transcription elongation factor Elf1